MFTGVCLTKLYFESPDVEMNEIKNQGSEKESEDEELEKACKNVHVNVSVFAANADLCF